ncbi:IclR family transcriptional regulator [Fulvitalea axinellae]
MPELDKKYIAPNLTKAVQVINFLTNQPAGATVQELTDSLDVAKTTIFRICYTLKHEGFFLQDDITGKFSLSRKFLQVGLASIGEESLMAKALPVMERIRDEFHETVLLGVLMNNEVSLMDQVMGDHPFTFFLKPRRSFVLHASAPGKVFLANLPEERYEDLVNGLTLTKFNERTLCTKETLFPELHRIKEQGYSVDRAEEIDGVHCVASPIHNQHGQVIAVIWMTGPAFRIPESDFPKIGEFMKAECQKLSEKLGYTEKKPQTT